MAKTKCETCDGCGKVVVDGKSTIPYSQILEMAKDPRCNMSAYMALNPLKLCPTCGGSGEVVVEGIDEQIKRLAFEAAGQLTAFGVLAAESTPKYAGHFAPIIEDAIRQALALKTKLSENKE